MQVLIVNQRFWPAATGSERWLLAIARRLAADGHRVTVATTDGLRDDFALNPHTPRVDAADQLDGIQIRRFAVSHLPGSPSTYLALRYGLLPTLAALPIQPARLHALSRWTPHVPGLYAWLGRARESFDLVLCANIVTDGIVDAAASAARRWGARFALVPFTHLGAGRQPGDDMVGRQYTLRHQRDLARRADRLLVMTEAERAFYLAHGVRPEAVHVVGAGVDHEAFLPGNADRSRRALGVSGPIVAYLAPLHPHKGILQVADAMERAWAHGSGLTLVAAGTPYPRGQSRLDRLKALRPQSVRVLGRLEEAEKRDLLAAADVLAMPSRTDSFGIVFLEAWAQGRPVVGSTAWGMSDVIEEGSDGFLVPFGDGPALAEVLVRLSQDPGLCDRLGEQGSRKTRLHYLWDHVYERVCAACSLR